MSDRSTDADIVRGLRRGDRAAWEALCEEYSARVWKYVARLVGSDREAVADVFQETMLAACKAGRALAEDTRLWPWLAAIGHHQSALYWRKLKSSRVTQLRSDPIHPHSNQDPLDRLLREETVELVRCLLAEMHADSAALLTGKYLDGLSVIELVQLLGGTQESVRSRLARARRDFRARYEREFRNQNPDQDAVTELAPRKGDLP